MGHGFLRYVPIYFLEDIQRSINSWFVRILRLRFPSQQGLLATRLIRNAYEYSTLLVGTAVLPNNLELASRLSAGEIRRKR